ncbi:LIS1 [Candida pseudojiufengensis]|uniref:LIS1 n=1 Tax=Candida pseudojiufengensis TaxID=497109 RepID=UPI0022254C18|nr:LIS1 [Candida pseudojiufengensis]KAI5959515.1 LIS1 [Candida pseudojiufengensis]
MQRSKILTQRQESELNRAIIQYLEPICSENESNQTLINQLSNLLLNENENKLIKNNEIIDNYLEKKWSSVIRLQKKILDLENELTNIRNIIDIDNDENKIKNTSILGKDRINWLPFSSSQNFETSSIINSVKLHPTLPLIYAGCIDGSIQIYNFVSNENSLPEKIIKAHTRSCTKLAISYNQIDINKNDQPQYILASCSSDLSIKIYDSKTFQHLRTLKGHEHTISSIKFSKNSNHLYSVSRDKTVKIWDIIEGICIKSFIGHSDWVRDLDICNSKEYDEFVLTCSNDQSGRLTHAQSGIGIAMMIGHSHVIETIKFLPLTSNIIIDKYLKENQDFFPSIPIVILDNEIYNEIGYKYCITGSRDNSIKIWLIPPPSIIQGRSPMPSKYNQAQAWLITTLTGHQSWVKCIEIHPNGRFIFSGSDDKTIKIWDLNDLNNSGNIGVIRSLSNNEGFLNDLDFARLTKSKNSSVNDKILTHEEILKDIEIRIRCMLVSGGTDNIIRLWK